MVTNCRMQALQDMWSKDSANDFVEYNLLSCQLTTMKVNLQQKCFHRHCIHLNYLCHLFLLGWSWIVNNHVDWKFLSISLLIVLLLWLYTGDSANWFAIKMVIKNAVATCDFWIFWEGFGIQNSLHGTHAKLQQWTSHDGSQHTTHSIGIHKSNTVS